MLDRLSFFLPPGFLLLFFFSLHQCDMLRDQQQQLKVYQNTLAVHRKEYLLKQEEARSLQDDYEKTLSVLHELSLQSEVSDWATAFVPDAVSVFLQQSVVPFVCSDRSY